MWSAPAWSQEKSARERGRELLDQGFAADQKGNTERAIQLYEDSFEVYPSYDVAGNLGVLEVKLQKYAAAANHLSYCLRHFPTGESAGLRSVIESNLASAQRHVGSVAIEVDEAAAAITIAKKVIGKSPLDYDYYLSPGKYGVRAASATGYAEAVFEIQQGERTEVALRLEPNPPPESVAPPPNPASEGPRDENRGRKPASLVPVAVMGGLSVATLASSVVLRVVAGSKEQKAQDQRPDSESECESMVSSECKELGRLLQQHDDFARASHVTLIVGAAGAAATIGYLTYALIQRKRTARVQASVGADRHGATLFLRGQF